MADLTYSLHVNAPPEEVFRAFTHATALRDWLSNQAQCEPGPEGFLFLRWNDGYAVTGAFTQYQPPHNLAFTWQGGDETTPSTVSVAIQSDGAGSQVNLTHAGLGTSAEALHKAWTLSMENLQSFLESGIDLRIARRPRLGIGMDELTPEIIAAQGFPVKEGIYLAGTAPGSGAEKAGLQKDDLLVSMNGVPLRAYSSFDAALRGLKAGDTPEVSYYRGAERFTVSLELGHFPMPELPETPAGLVEKLRPQYDMLIATLRERCAALSETQADHHPAPGEWSVKQLIGHFILCERDYQSWVADMLHDNVTGDALYYRPNIDQRIDALLLRLGTLEATLHELELAAQESLDLLAALPETFTTRRKHFYRRAADWALSITSGHLTDEHQEQLEHTIAAALKIQ